MVNLICFLISAAIVVGDQLFKHYIVAVLGLGEKIPVIDGLFHLTYVRNTGAAFNFLEGNTWFLFVLSAACSILIAVMIVKFNFDTFTRLMLSFVLGGAIGNAIDRCVLGFVVDMIEVEFIEFPVFNIADSFIVVGGILFCVAFVVEEYKASKKKGAPRKMRELDRLSSNKAESNDGADSAEDGE